MAIKCAECGRFLSYAEMLDCRARFHYVPDNAFSAEVCEWSCAACNNDKVDALTERQEHGSFWGD